MSMSMSVLSAVGPVSEAVLRIGRITLHETAAYLAILAVLALLLSAVSGRRR